MKTAKVFLTGFVMMFFAGMVFSGIAMGEDEGQLDLNNYACKDVMRMSGNDRDLAIVALHAFIMGKKGTTKIDIAKLTGVTDTFIETCLDNPNNKALDTMDKLSK
jgi:hypothetical protein